MSALDRRSFLKQTALAAIAAGVTPRHLSGAEPDPVPVRSARVVVVHGEDPAALLTAGVSKLGEWKTWVRPGIAVTIKPNVAWASTPEQGANTHPDLVEAAIRGCQSAGAGSVTIPENPCSPANRAFSMSGIADVASRTGVRLYRPEDGDYRKVELPRGKILRETEAAKDVLDAGFLINMPVAKVHGGANLTLCLKNWLGSIRDRGELHREGLHQCIADLNTLIRAHLNVVDATRILMTNGPRGPGELRHPHQVILSGDPVAADAVASVLFDRKPFDVPHIRIAHEMGIGCGILDDISIEHIRI